MKQFFGNFETVLLNRKRFPFVFELQSCAVIEVTDGWYGIRATLDRPLTRLLHDRKIVVGQKLFVYGAELIGSEQAVSPLEVHVRLGRGPKMRSWSLRHFLIHEMFTILKEVVGYLPVPYACYL